MKSLTTAVGLLAALPAVALPVLDGAVSVSQDSVTRKVTISYAMSASGDPGIVTFDIKTNSPSGYVSVGGQALCNAWGDVNRKVSVGSGKKIYWQPDGAGFEFKLSDIRAEVNLWPTNNPPDYMVLDLGGQKKHRFFPNAEQIPLGVTNDIYKVEYLVMRKIPAAGVTWRMGAGANEEPIEGDRSLHLVTLKEDYYLGIYEMTQGQMRRLGLSAVVSDWSTFKNLPDSDLRPVDGVSWFNIRYKSTWPANGHEFGQYSYFKYFTQRIGNMLFDLPTETAWEYACRAGTKTKYHNGKNTGADEVAWYAGNGESATHPVGSKAPNPWGLYDMIGNVREWCLDYYKTDFGISDEDFDDVNYTGPTACETGVREQNDLRVLRGGAFKNNTWEAKSAGRNWGPEGSSKNSDVGFRVWTPAVYPL